MVQFKEVDHHGGADMNIWGVILDVGTALSITCKDKGSVLHQWLKACSVEERTSGASPCLMLISRKLLRRSLGKIEAVSKKGFSFHFFFLSFLIFKESEQETAAEGSKDVNLCKEKHPYK